MVFPNLEAMKTTAIDGKIPVVIGFRQRPGRTEEDIVRRHGGEIKYVYTLINAISATLPEKAIDAIRRNPNVEYVEIDEKIVACQQTVPWGISKIGATTVHYNGNKGTGIKIAVIDSGIDYGHPDLTGNYKGGYNFVAKNSDPFDDHGHGTHVSGTIAALDNTFGVIGVAPEAEIYAVKVLDGTGSGYNSDVIAGIQWSVNNTMRIANMSLGSKITSRSLKNACDNAYNKGLLLIAAAGNDGNAAGTGNNVGYPAKYDSVVAVAAIDMNNLRAWFSSTGPDVELSAPGVGVYSTMKGGLYGNMSGTSMACPHAVGTAALVMKANPGFTNVQTRIRMQVTADNLGVAGKDNLYGYGLVNAIKATAM